MGLGDLCVIGGMSKSEEREGVEKFPGYCANFLSISPLIGSEEEVGPV